MHSLHLIASLTLVSLRVSLRRNFKIYTTEVINDPLGQTTVPAVSEFCFILKSGLVRTDNLFENYPFKDIFSPLNVCLNSLNIRA